MSFLSNVQNVWELDEGCDYLIVKSKTGKFYSNQAGCLACTHPQEEGFLIPLPIQFDDSSFHEELAWEKIKITDKLADKIDTEFARQGLAFKVDRVVGELQEAWIPVIILRGYRKGKRGVFCYQNCD